MFDALFNYIENYAKSNLSADDKKLIEQTFKLRKLRKRQYYLQAGDINKQIGFVLKGAFRMYSVDDRGHEHIVRFSLENWWVADYESYMLQTPSKYNIDAVEDAEILIISNTQREELQTQIPAFADMIKELDKRANIATQNRVHAAISLTAEERFNNLQNTYPYFLQRFPQSMIASYLGISPETLSRIRKASVGR
ncbi:Crp/Fnr family transcriptional regulator [uncultured Mucilaginibacter sp.]|uniref:Crp/Fnr family transcriptional regulator n=1 Tax=uncultured Mucilaginibacter sp. TaxID=797541 RepID=UPI0025DF2F6B|nr:Crp/Fnr family transcriptional regulator [uncultured Mucilaginibacter sp.]